MSLQPPSSLESRAFRQTRRTSQLWLFLGLTALSPLLPGTAQAVRPFVTDDAEVVGHRMAQIETWVEMGRAQLEHNFVLAYGPTQWSEVSVGFVQALDRGSRYGILGPLVELKAAFMELPPEGRALAVTVGALPPFGSGSLQENGWRAFSYLALTESMWGGDVLIHANLGIATGQEARVVSWGPTAGLGLQAHLAHSIHGTAETFYGDPYDPAARGGLQVGARYIPTERLQLDATIGTPLDDRVAAPLDVLWFSLGLRIVSGI